MRTIIVLGFAILAGGQALACSQPEAPHCVLPHDRFSDSSFADNCRRHMDEYRQRLEAFRSCTQAQAQAATGSDIDRLNAQSTANGALGSANEAQSNAEQGLQRRLNMR
jgi:hypothetical protein